MAVNKKITTNIREIRETRGLKQKFVAEKLGITASYYSQIENGHRNPQVEHLYKLRVLFDVSLDDIFFRSCIANCDYNPKQAI